MSRWRAPAPMCKPSLAVEGDFVEFRDAGQADHDFGREQGAGAS
jgi:hypothetical protein